MDTTTELEHHKALKFSSRIQRSLFSMAFLILLVHEITTTNFLSQFTLPVALFVGATVYASISFLFTMIVATPVEYLINAILRISARPKATETL